MRRAALGDATRLHILARQCRHGPLSIVRLTAGSNVTRQAIAKHLHALAGAGLVSGGRTGRGCMWELRTGRLAEIRLSLDRMQSAFYRPI